VALLVVGLCGASTAHAQATVPRAADASAWTSLTPAQQSALQPLKRDWADIDAPRKQKWLEIAARMPSMSAEDRQRVQQRMAEWARLSPEERGRARLQFQEARQLSPQQRQSRWDAYMALPAEERRALAEAARTVPQSNKSASRMAGGATPPAQKSGTGGKPAAPAPKAVAPTLVQAKPGASTTLISNSATPPAHAQAGQPKIAASKDVVNRRTLLPQAGPQAAAPAPAASSGR
jgi:hypothetical protein